MNESSAKPVFFLIVKVLDFFRLVFWDKKRPKIGIFAPPTAHPIPRYLAPDSFFLIRLTYIYALPPCSCE